MFYMQAKSIMKFTFNVSGMFHEDKMTIFTLIIPCGYPQIPVFFK